MVWLVRCVDDGEVLGVYSTFEKAVVAVEEATVFGIKCYPIGMEVE